MNLEFLMKALEAFNFSLTLFKLIKTYYQYFIKNVFILHYFIVQRGNVGDLLSPYLFILFLEVLPTSVRNNTEIKGIEVDDKEIKLT